MRKIADRFWYAAAAAVLCFLLLAGAGCGRQTEKEESVSETLFRDLAEGAEQIALSGDANGKCILLELPEVCPVGYLRLRWDRAQSGWVQAWSIAVYTGTGQGREAVMASAGGAAEGAWTEVCASQKAPYLAEECFALPETIQSRWLLVTVQGAELQPEISVYAQNPWEQVFAALQPHFEDGALVTSGLPEWLTAEYLGCRPAAVLDANGRIQELLEEKQVHVGYRLSYGDWSVDTPDYVLTAQAGKEQPDPEGKDGEASAPDAAGREGQADAAGGRNMAVNPRPAVIPQLQEWRGAKGMLVLKDGGGIYAEAPYQTIAGQLTEEMADLCGWQMQAGRQAAPGQGDILLKYCGEECLGEEGYRIELDEYVTISAYDARGMFWGTRTLLQMLKLYGGDTLQAAGEVSLPRGAVRDYPTYPVRSFGIDVARNSVSLHMLREMVKTLSWYKLNEISVHLNDNALLVYTEKKDSWDSVYDAYSAFRLESSIVGPEGKALTAADLSYGKEEFAELVSEASAYGVSVVPEIDTPAHSLAITSAFPELGLHYQTEAADMLDLSRPESTALVKDIWRDALPAFADCTAVHIGGDEYFGGAQDYIDYENTMLDFLAAEGKKLRMWGSLSWIRGSGFVQPRDGLELLIWNTDWADPQTMHREGFSLINAWHGELYLIPGGGYDYLDREKLYRDFRPNLFYKEDGSGSMELPEYSARVRGAQICMWNDLTDELSAGISEYDMFDRLYTALPMFAQKCWNGAAERPYDDFKQDMACLGLAPGSDPYDETIGPEEETQALDGPPYRISLTLTLQEEKTGEILLCEEERGGNYYAVWLRDGNGNIRIAGEEYTEDFEYSIPAGVQVTLTWQGEKDHLSLYADGEKIESIGSEAPFEDHATFLFPAEQLRKWQRELAETGGPVSADGFAVTEIVME
ncbi:MAG: family 20 glycosylhydrolase [Lachnospiraceae bacterium]|nr:family 20 glycosylhydrolase [Lachnospiraceae bacterium]